MRAGYGERALSDKMKAMHLTCGRAGRCTVVVAECEADMTNTTQPDSKPDQPGDRDPSVEDRPANNDAKLVENINDRSDDVTTPKGETPELGVDNIDDDDEALREALKGDALGGTTQVDEDGPKQTAGG
jgi:hypothetical protein